MVVVIDANIGMAQVISLPYSEKASAHWRQWRSDRVRIVVPSLWWYEFVNGIRRSVFLGLLTHELALEVLEQMALMDWEEVPPSSMLNRSISLNFQ